MLGWNLVIGTSQPVAVQQPAKATRDGSENGKKNEPDGLMRSLIIKTRSCVKLCLVERQTQILGLAGVR